MEENYSSDFEKRKLKARVLEIFQVSTLPLTLKKVLDVVENENSTTSDLVRALEHDQALASKLVAMSNSAFYGYRREVRSIPDAAVVLGFSMVRNLAVSTSLFKLASGSDDSSRESLKRLWQHSFETAFAAALIAARTGVARKDDAFLAGLISNIGRVILYQLFGDAYLRVSSHGKEGLLLREAEAFGAPHTEVGAWFAEKYRFPKECILAMLHHHSPETFLTNYGAGSLQIIPAVYLAELLTSANMEGFEYDLVPSRSHAEILAAVYMDEAGMNEVKAELDSMQGTIKEFYSS
jgi:HD-like signal output (HDOD) protein